MRAAIRTSSLTLAGLLAACAHAPPKPSADAARGKAIFLGTCAGCHGESGRGDGEEASYYEPSPANFTLPAFARRPDAELLESIHKGKGNMPPFANKLSEQELRDVLAYVRSLQP